MVEEIKKEEWEKLPRQAQQEIRDFFLFLRKKYENEVVVKSNETALLSERTLAVDWLNESEDEAWASFQ